MLAAKVRAEIRFRNAPSISLGVSLAGLIFGLRLLLPATRIYIVALVLPIIIRRHLCMPRRILGLPILTLEVGLPLLPIPVLFFLSLLRLSRSVLRRLVLILALLILLFLILTILILTVTVLLIRWTRLILAVLLAVLRYGALIPVFIVGGSQQSRPQHERSTNSAYYRQSPHVTSQTI